METEVLLPCRNVKAAQFQFVNERRNTKMPVSLYRPILKESPPTGTARERVTANWVSVPPTKHTPPRPPVRPRSGSATACRPPGRSGSPICRLLPGVMKNNGPGGGSADRPSLTPGPTSCPRISLAHTPFAQCTPLVVINPLSLSLFRSLPVIPRKSHARSPTSDETTTPLHCLPGSFLVALRV